MTEELHQMRADMTGRSITRRLEELGFVTISRSTDGAHVLLRREHIEIVAPGVERDVPEKVAQMIEHSLEATLGPKWLLGDATIGENSEDDPGSLAADAFVMLDVVVMEPIGETTWRAFLADDLTTIGFGSSRHDALRDLKAAAALRIGRESSRIVLLTPDVV